MVYGKSTASQEAQNIVRGLVQFFDAQTRTRNRFRGMVVEELQSVTDGKTLSNHSMTIWAGGLKEQHLAD